MHHNNNNIMISSFMGFHLYLVSICVVITCWCDFFGLLSTCCSHVQSASHYLLSYSCNVSVNGFNEKNFNVHEWSKQFNPFQFSQFFIRLC